MNSSRTQQTEDDSSSGKNDSWTENALPPPPREAAAQHDDAMSGLVARVFDSQNFASPLRLSETDVLQDGSRPEAVWPAIPNHELIRLLGTGGMGAVYLARDLRTRRLVAVKVLAIRSIDGDDRARFQLEAESAANLRHPNIITVHEVGQSEDRPYFVVDYLEGGSLAAKIREAPLDVRMAASFVESIARAVEVAHRAGVLHRDIKPSNILLRTNPDSQELTPVLTDFGLARRLDEDQGKTRSGVVLGTPAYMPPEQAIGSRELTPAVDVYALGATLYEALVGHPPFRAATMLEILDQVRTTEPVSVRRLRPTIPKDLDTICRKSLEKSPAKRYRTANDLADDLRRFREGLPILARPVSSLERFRKWNQRQPTLAALLYVSAIAVCAAIAGFAIHNHQLGRQVLRAESGELLAREQQAIAEKNYAAARDTLEKMIGRIDDPQFAGIPRLEVLRRQLHEDSLDYYEKLVKERDDSSAELKLDAARAGVKAAAMQLKLGQEQQAVQNCQRGIDRLRELCAADPANLDYVRNLADAHLTLGFAMSGIRNRPGIYESYRTASELYERLIREAPNDIRSQLQFAQMLQSLGAEQIGDGRKMEAIANFERSIEIRERLAKTNPAVPREQGMLADSHINLGLLRSDKVDVASRHFQRAEQILGPLQAANPKNLEFTNSLGGLYTNWGRLLSASGQAESALKKLDRSVQLLDELHHREPELSSVKSRLLNAHGSRAMALDAARRYAESAKDWDKVVEYCEPKRKNEFRVFGAVARFRAGNQAAAEKTAQELAKVDQLDGPTCINIACLYSLLAGTITPEKRRASQSSQAEFDRLALQAVTMLQRANSIGHFQKADQVKALERDQDLAPIRSTKCFVDFLSALKDHPEANVKQ